MTQSRPRVVRIALVQMRCSEDVADNLARGLVRIDEAAAAGAQIVCLPELFRSRYFCQTEDHAKFDLAEPIPGSSTEALSAKAKQHGIVIVGSLFERRAAGVYHNTAVVLDADGSLAGVYRKMHIPDDPLYYEKFYFTPGDLGFRSFQTRFAKIGVLVCWDQWFPEAARLTALTGAEMLFYPTAIGWHQGEKEQFGEQQYDAWQTIQRSHAVANGVFVAAPNRIGTEGTVDFWGGSFVAAPFGPLLAKASHDREELLVVDCDLARVEETRQHWPFLRDRRIDFYGGLVKRMIDDA
ncbi:MAG: carbon-nitrogen hydrolase [Deltaproteobacteria bacterium]|nr:carbon-nitrogen hydrolase [Deltaproteobacteria bacterium]